MNNYVQSPIERYTAVLVAVVIVGTCLFLIVRNEPFQDPNLVTVTRTLLSLGTAILGATIPGFMHVSWKGAGFAVRAMGALALFVVTFFGTPHVFPPLASAAAQNQTCLNNVSISGGNAVINCFTGDDVVRQEVERLVNQAPLSPEKKKEVLAAWLDKYASFAQAIEGLPSNQVRETLRSAPNLAAAIAILDEQIAQQQVEIAKFYFMRGLAAELQFDMQTAHKFYQAAYANSPDDAEYAERYATLLCIIGNYDLSISIYGETAGLLRDRIAKGEEGAEDRLACMLQNLGVAYSEIGAHDKAVAASQEAVELRRRGFGKDSTSQLKFALALGNLAAHVGKAGDSVRRASYLRRVVDTLREIPAGFTRDVNLARALDDLADAGSGTPEEEAESVLLCQKHDPPPANYLRVWLEACGIVYRSEARRLIDAGRHGEAAALPSRCLELYERLSQRTPAEALEMAASNMTLGSAQSSSGEFADAITSYTRALALIEEGGLNTATRRSLLGQALNNRGWARYKHGDHIAADADYVRALELDSADVTVLTNRALAMFVLQSSALGIRKLAEAIQLDPETTSFEKHLWLYIADCRSGHAATLTDQQIGTEDLKARTIFRIMKGEFDLSALTTSPSVPELSEETWLSLGLYAGEYLVIAGEVGKAQVYFGLAANSEGSESRFEREVARAELVALRAPTP